MSTDPKHQVLLDCLYGASGLYAQKMAGNADDHRAQFDFLAMGMLVNVVAFFAVDRAAVVDLIDLIVRKQEGQEGLEPRIEIAMTKLRASWLKGLPEPTVAAAE